jgi:AhpD family alkylhydroperoxidase
LYGSTARLRQRRQHEDSHHARTVHRPVHAGLRRARRQADLPGHRADPRLRADVLQGVPGEGIAAAWDELKTVQLNPATALSTKTKELIGLAVAAQVPCRYCVYFHTNVAKLGGANDAEVKDAIAMAAITRHWSTVLNGSLIDEAQFRKEVDKIVANAKKAAKR